MKEERIHKSGSHVDVYQITSDKQTKRAGQFKHESVRRKGMMCGARRRSKLSFWSDAVLSYQVLGVGCRAEVGRGSGGAAGKWRGK